MLARLPISSAFVVGIGRDRASSIAEAELAVGPVADCACPNTPLNTCEIRFPTSPPKAPKSETDPSALTIGAELPWKPSLDPERGGRPADTTSSTVSSRRAFNRRSNTPRSLNAVCICCCAASAADCGFGSGALVVEAALLLLARPSSGSFLLAEGALGLFLAAAAAAPLGAVAAVGASVRKKPPPPPPPLLLTSVDG